MTVGIRRMSVVTPCSLSILLSNQGPFPPPALPSFTGSTDPSATLSTQTGPHGFPVDACNATDRASRVATFFIFHACWRHYPGRCRSVPMSLASQPANGLPPNSAGSASALRFSRPFNVHLRSGPTSHGQFASCLKLTSDSNSQASLRQKSGWGISSTRFEQRPPTALSLRHKRFLRTSKTSTTTRRNIITRQIQVPTESKLMMANFEVSSGGHSR